MQQQRPWEAEPISIAGRHVQLIGFLSTPPIQVYVKNWTEQTNEEEEGRTRERKKKEDEEEDGEGKAEEEDEEEREEIESE